MKTLINVLLLIFAVLVASTTIAQDRIDPATLKAVFGIEVDPKISRAATFASEQCAILFANKDLRAIEDKVPTWAERKITPFMFSNREYIAESEKPVVLLWLKKLKDCYDVGSAVRTLMPRQSNPAYENFMRFDEFFISKLLSGDITYGELTNYRVVLSEDLQLAINAFFVWPENAETITSEIIRGWQGLAKPYEPSAPKR